MSLKLYYDLLSQPSRAVYIFLRFNNISFVPKPVVLGDQFNSDNMLINKFHTVPVIDDQGFKLMESVAILRYLHRENNVEDFWFPKNSIKQAKIDEYLEWQHINTSFLCNFYFQRKYLMPLRTGQPTQEELIEESKERMLNCLEKIENIWLEDKSFIVGDKISIADLIAACDLEQLRITGFDLNNNFPKISSWMDRVRTELNPHYDEAHSIVYKLAKKV